MAGLGVGALMVVFAGGDTTDGTDEPGHARFDDDRAPHLATGHAGGAQDADLADALEDVHREGIDDAQRRDDDGDHGKGVE